jgi:hypothetical protein
MTFPIFLHLWQKAGKSSYSVRIQTCREYSAIHFPICTPQNCKDFALLGFNFWTNGLSNFDMLLTKALSKEFLRVYSAFSVRFFI